MWMGPSPGGKEACLRKKAPVYIQQNGWKNEMAEASEIGRAEQRDAQNLKVQLGYYAFTRL